ncbi:carbohydrate binding-domain-containing protein [Mycena galopus ATCC 62051]|nr:carbohydrate binding-domain-containing protein [Mycena galopus ATCC 62051]
MARLVYLVFTAVIGSVFAAECLWACGDSNYYPSQYTCFEDGSLCPIENGDRYLKCGDACYSTSLYTCSNTTLKPVSHSGVEALEDCGSSTFYPSQCSMSALRENSSVPLWTGQQPSGATPLASTLPSFTVTMAYGPQLVLPL